MASNLFLSNEFSKLNNYCFSENMLIKLINLSPIPKLQMMLLSAYSIFNEFLS